MKTLDERLQVVERHVKDDEITIMIIGLGSVGTYLLDFLVSKNDPAIKLVVVGRNQEKMQSDVNIVRVASLIRELNKSQILIEGGVDLNDIDAITKAISKYNPDFIVNSSRAYPGLKYGSISWSNVRAYGIWTPLSIRFTKNIMEACNKADTDAVVINTSYSDAVIPWLKSAGKAYPDFGSGNLNHLIPRMKFAVADILGVDDFWNVDFNFAAAHFHDVCISKEGQTEGVELPLKIYYKGEDTIAAAALAQVEHLYRIDSEAGLVQGWRYQSSQSKQAISHINILSMTCITHVVDHIVGSVAPQAARDDHHRQQQHRHHSLHFGYSFVHF